MKINSEITGNGIRLELKGKRYCLKYPEGVWENYPDSAKRALANELTYVMTMHLPVMLNANKISYNTAIPAFEPFYFKMMLNHLPFCADIDKVEAGEYLRRLMNAEFRFSSYEPDPVNYEPYDWNPEEKAVINFSFGKDSLLSHALLEEIGIKTSLVYVSEPNCPIENNYKDAHMEKFSREFGTEVNKLYNETGLLHDYEYWNIGKTEFGYGHLITEYGMDALPFAHAQRAKYIVFGNEKSCEDYYVGKDGFKCFPVYDQSHGWLVHLNQMTRQFSGGIVNTISVVEPINELAIIKILHSRYKEIAKYQMSCFPDETEFGKHNAWCEHCSKCARMFVFMKACGLDTRRVGFKSNMFNSEFRNVYSIFGNATGEMIGWDASGANKDELLFAFYLAYKNGASGALIDEFRKLYLEDVKKNEDVLYKRFFGTYDSITMPKHIKKKMTGIFDNELSMGKLPGRFSSGIAESVNEGIAARRMHRQIAGIAKEALQQ
ncbi:MAG: hypothetical protein HYW05_03500 [Candidatus Diapherotrites archaeon]|nr:hypothetical protein [Candidatus Diapherotrites archaeon]